MQPALQRVRAEIQRTAANLSTLDCTILHTVKRATHIRRRASNSQTGQTGQTGQTELRPNKAQWTMQTRGAAVTDMRVGCCFKWESQGLLNRVVSAEFSQHRSAFQSHDQSGSRTAASMKGKSHSVGTPDRIIQLPQPALELNTEHLRCRIIMGLEIAELLP